MQLRVHNPAPNDGTIHPFRAALEGTFAGLLAALLVAIVHAFGDIVAGDPLRTPSTLSALILGSEGAVGTRGILLFSAVHVSLWVAAGIASAWAVAIADAHPRALRLLFVVLAVGWISLLYLSGALSVAGVGSLHLWIGTIFGAGAVVVTLLWRHPRLLTQPERNQLTDASRIHLQDAFRFESDCLAAARAARQLFDVPALTALVDRKAGTLTEIALTMERLEIERPGPDESPDPPDPATLDLALREAIARELKAIRHFVAFLTSTDDPALRELLLERRFESLDENLPILEEARRNLGRQTRPPRA
jgi:hypothetical protein